MMRRVLAASHLATRIEHDLTFVLSSMFAPPGDVNSILLILSGLNPSLPMQPLTYSREP